MTFPLTKARSIVGNDAILDRIVPNKSVVSAFEMRAALIAAELMDQNLAASYACRAGIILAASHREDENASLSIDHLHRLAPPIGSGFKHTRALTLPPPGEASRMVTVSFSNHRHKIQEAK